MLKQEPIDMTKETIIRRIIGITALVLWVVAIVPKFFLSENMMVWQLDNWALLFAPLLTLAYIVMLAIHIVKGKHWIVKLSVCISCALIICACIVMFFSSRHWLYVKIWGNKDYVVYSEYRGAIDPDEYVLYKRNGLLNKKMYNIGGGWRGQLRKVEFTFYEPLDLIREERDAVPFDSDSIYHITVYHRLSDGHCYSQEQNDSLQALINKQ
ncbi:MAG: hypothetical protein J5848_03485 [Bacteroidales bacterium]|nr:hypothetical protein [Bacteroidales bacterium]